LTVCLVLVFSLGCGHEKSGTVDTTVSAVTKGGEYNALRNGYFGDLHVHTGYSFDAFMFAIRATPDDAYRYAKGEPIEHAAGFNIQLESGPLDFQAVTDHAMFLGVFPAMADPSQPISRHPTAKRFVELVRQFASGASSDERKESYPLLRSMVGWAGEPADPAFFNDDIVRSTWQEIIDAAERHYQPGTFTTFVGYEYTSGPDEQNLHRNVIYRGSAVPEMPFSRFDSENPEDLWAWMDDNRARGMEAIAIPHNSNGSNG